MAQFNLKTAIEKLAAMIAEHQDVSDLMTPADVAGYLAANYPWLQGLGEFYMLSAESLARAACCWTFAWGIQYNMNQGNPAPYDQPIPLQVWTDPAGYKDRCVAFCDAIGALHPFVGNLDSLTVRPEYGGPAKALIPALTALRLALTAILFGVGLLIALPVRLILAACVWLRNHA